MLTSGYSYNLANQIEGYTYDANGNLTNAGTTTYTWDGANRLTSVTAGTSTHSYSYDPFGNRISQTTGGSTTQYLVDPLAGLPQVLSEYGPNNATTHYLPGIAQKQGATWSYFGTDGIGSTRFMFNSARTTIYAANYDPYGQVMAQYLPDATPSFGFTGQMTDASGLQYLRARYYNPSTGTFLSQDPVQGVPGSASIRWNPYIYAGANPTSLTDPNGLTPRCPSGFLGQLCQQAFNSMEAGFQAIFEGTTAPARVTTETTQKASQKVYETSQTHWAGSAAAGLIDPVDIAVTLNNWANRDFFILDPLAFLPVLSVGALRGLFRHGDEVAQGAGRIGDEVSGILGRSDEFGGRQLFYSRGGGGGGGVRRPDLSSISNDLQATLEEFTDFQKGLCADCANKVGDLLQHSNFDVDVVRIQIDTRKFPPASQLPVLKPGGGEELIATNGWHEVLRLKTENGDFFLDALSFKHRGVQALTIQEYASLWPEDIRPLLVYFSHRLPGEGYYGAIVRDLKNAKEVKGAVMRFP